MPETFTGAAGMTDIAGMELKLVPIADLRFYDYHRTIRKRHAKRLAEHFDPIRAGVIIVSKRDGEYYVIDGGQRIKAMQEKQITVCPAMILYDLTIEQEADYFRKQGDDFSRLSPYEKFHAGLYALDPIDREIDDLIKRYNFVFIGKVEPGNRITSVGAAKRIYTKYNADTLEKTLALIRETWNGNSNVLRKDYFLGIAEFVKYHNAADFAERMREVEFGEIELKYQELRTKNYNNPKSYSFYLALVECYNQSVIKNKVET
ncbi:hypothetical protein FACS1894184_16050 [Clostridia bacterium]|nr:hypothetical protein FACS1894184_16050 [Clostridia bacterium]